MTYRLLRRSCKLMGAVVISPLPPVLLEPLQTAGFLRSTDITPRPRYYEPSRSPLACSRFPGVSGYTASLLRRFRAGTRRVSPVAQHHLVTVLSLPTPPKWLAASVHATRHAAFARKVRARPSDFSTFEAIWVHLRYGPVTRSPSLKMALSVGFRTFSFLPACYSSYGALDFYPGGTLTHWLMPAFTGRTLHITNPPREWSAQQNRRNSVPVRPSRSCPELARMRRLHR